jgi:toxin ParE1/3/4
VKKYLLHREAELELNAAMAYYEEQRRGLGLALLAEVERTAEMIRQFPAAWPLHGPAGHRKAALVGFPFALHYLELPDGVWISAVAHAKREPFYWRGRAR